MRMIIGLAVLVVVSGASADVLHTTTGQRFKARVMNYANATFEVVGEDGMTRRYPSAMVKRIEFDGDGVSSTLKMSDRREIPCTVTAYENLAFTVQTGTGQASKVLSNFVVRADFGAGLSDKIKLISRGGAVQVSEHLVRGKVTIVDYYADWCGPCRQIAPFLEQLAKDDKDVFLRKIDIINWDSAVAKQYKLQALPHIEIYDRAGKLTGVVKGAGQAQVQEHVNKAKSSAP